MMKSIFLASMFALTLGTAWNLTAKAPGCGNCAGCSAGCENCPGCQNGGCANCPGCSGASSCCSEK